MHKIFISMFLLLIGCTDKRPVEQRLEIRIEDGLSGPLITCIGDNVPLHYFLDQFMLHTGLTLDPLPPEAMNAFLTVSLSDVEWRPALDVILDSVDLTFIEEDSRIKIMTREDYEALPPIEKHYSLSSKDYSNRVTFIEYVLSGYEDIDFQHEPKKQTYMVTAKHHLHSNVEDCIRQINRMDRVPVFPEIAFPDTIPDTLSIPKGFTLYEHIVISLEHVEAYKIVDKLKSMDEGRELTLNIIAAGNAVVVSGPKDQLTRIASICEYLDDPRWYVDP